MSSSQSSQLPNASKPPSVPDHELLRCIGRGAYGEVWLARSITGAFRAVKIVSRQSFDHERPFEREFEGILKFEPISRRHDSQVDILHVGRGEDYFYYVMELADDQATGGQINPDNYVPRTLKSDLLFHGRLPFEECVRIGVALTTALEHLHENDLVHRDVKPSNIIFVNGVAKLADIGLVTSVDATRSYVGTEGFAAPEGPGSPKADLYSLGKVLYEISTGKDRQEFPELPTQLRELPDREGVIELNAVIARACRHDPKERYESAQAMHAELALLQSGKSLARLHRIEKRLRFVQRAGALITVLAGIIAIGWLWQARQTKVVRDLAASNARLANEKATIAEQSRQRLIQTQTANGLRFMENEDFATAALWFAEVLKSANGDAELERRQRDRLAALFARFPKPIARFSMGCSGSGVKVSPDGKWLIGVGRQTNNGVVTGEVRIWDTTTFQQLYSLSMPSIDGRVFVSPSGRWALTSTDKEKQIWDVVAGKLLNAHVEAGGIGGKSAWSPDETKIATAAADGTNVYVLAFPSGRLLLPPLEHSNRVVQIVIDPTARCIATGTIVSNRAQMAEARVWDLANGKPNTGWITTENPALGLVFSPDGKAISVFGGGWLDASYVMSSHRIEVFEPLSGQRLFPALSHSGPVFAASFSLNNRHLAIASGDRTVNIWDARSGQIVHSSLKNAGIAVRLSFSPDGNWLAAMNHDTPMQLWNIRSATPLCPPLSHEGELSDFTFLNNGQRLTTLTLSGKICVWDLARIEPASPPLVSEHGNPWTAAVFSPSGGQVATVTGCGDVRVWDTCSGLTLGRLLMGPDRIIGGMINNSASWSHDGLSVAAPFKETVRIWDVVLSKERLNPLKHENIVIYTEFSPDGKRIATASADFTAQIWDANTGIPLCLPLRHSYYVQRIRFSPDGRRVVTASNDRTARVWDAFTGEAISPPMPSPGHVLHVAFSPDSRRIAMSDNEGTIYIREADTGQQVGSVMHHSTLVHHIQFSPDGRYLLSTSMDRTARVWDAQTGQPICPPLVHTGYVVSGDVSPDSQRVVTGSYDCTARIWDIQTGEPLGPPFKHEKQILHVSFSPDGNQIATSSLDDTAQVWHVPKLDWSTEEILAAAHLLTGSRLEDSERVEPLSRAELEAAWSAVSFRFQTLTNRSVFEKARWHHRRALINEMRHDWYAAEFHARRWLELQPENAEANAALARVLECRIPARSSAAESELIDLSDVYNASLAIPWHAGPPGNHLAELPRGIQTLAGTRFDIRGLIQVVSEPAVTAKYPKQIAGIRIGRKSSRLQFLHSIQGGVLPDGTKVGHYVVHYVSSRTEEIPIIYGRDARDWHELPEHPVEASDAVIAWRGNNPATKISGATCIRLFKKTWINPAPDIEITSLDFVADHADAAPFLVALTAE